jgi:hypothetical protein
MLSGFAAQAASWCRWWLLFVMQISGQKAMGAHHSQPFFAAGYNFNLTHTHLSTDTRGIISQCRFADYDYDNLNCTALKEAAEPATQYNQYVGLTKLLQKRRFLICIPFTTLDGVNTRSPSHHV